MIIPYANVLQMAEAFKHIGNTILSINKEKSFTFKENNQSVLISELDSFQVGIDFTPKEISTTFTFVGKKVILD